MKIDLGRGYEAEIDDEDHEKIAAYNWHALVVPTNVYACAYPEGTALLLHRLLLDAPLEMVVDHKDGNGLNNRRANLRLATASQNRFNQDFSLALSGQRGVSRNGKRWRARINQNGVEHYIGTFDTIEEAAAAYTQKAVELYGEFAG